MPKLIFVHGRGLQDPPDILHDSIAQALQVGLQHAGLQDCPEIPPESLHVAYWSELFHSPLNVDIESPATRATTGSEHPTHTAILGMLLDHYWRTGRHRLATPPTAREPGAAPRIRAAAVAVTPEPPASVDDTERQHEDAFVRDVIKFFYLGYARRVQEPLVKLLVDLPLDDGVAIISHSLGVVITYDVLIRRLDDIARSRAAAGKVPLLIDSWVALGSPLGWALELQAHLPLWVKEAAVDIVIDHAPAGTVEPITLPNTFPAVGLKRWYNLYDPHDPISYPPIVRLFRNDTLTISTTFLDQGVERVLDIRISNELATIDPGPLGIQRHNKTGYLHSAQFGLLLHDFALRWS